MIRGHGTLRAVKDELLSTLRTFLAFETVAGKHQSARECLDWLSAAFLGSSARLVHGEYSGCPYLYLPAETPKLLFFAHIDVVPADSSLFVLRIKGNRAMGRGVKDMKGATLPFLLAYRDTCASGGIPPVSILLTSDEETAGRTIPTLLEQGLIRAPVAFTPDTGNVRGIIVEHKGVIWADLIADGRGGHSALPWDAMNPISVLAEAVTSLRAAFPEGNSKEWRMTVTPTMLEGSLARNQIPASARCSLDIRYTEEEGEEYALQRVQAVLGKGMRLEKRVSASPLKTDPNHPMVKRVKSIAEEVTRESVPIEREHGATDARYFGEAGIPAFLYGPLGGGLHASDEWVSISSLLEYYEISMRLLRELSA